MPLNTSNILGGGCKRINLIKLTVAGFGICSIQTWGFSYDSVSLCVSGPYTAIPSCISISPAGHLSNRGNSKAEALFLNSVKSAWVCSCFLQCWVVYHHESTAEVEG